MTRSTLTCACGLIALLLSASCAPTNVTTTSAYAGPLPSPNMIIVYNFAATPEEVKLDPGLSGQIVEAAKKEPRTEQERQIGQACADALAKHLVEELQGMGYVVTRSQGTNSSMDGNSLLIQGQFVTIDEGNQTRRVTIGLGMGRSDVRVVSQVYETLPKGPVLVEQFTGDAKSGFKPGMAETLGAGAAVGSVGTAAAVSGVVTVGSEAFSANVDADASRMAKDLAKRIQDLYRNRGWPTL
jgi:hypothetical protein